MISWPSSFVIFIPIGSEITTTIFSPGLKKSLSLNNLPLVVSKLIKGPLTSLDGLPILKKSLLFEPISISFELSNL